MQTSTRPTAFPSPPPPPATLAANEKLASGPQSSPTELNVWQTQTFTQQMQWGNDYMHARYYSPNLGRFLSVDPANSGKIGSSQSWNRYGYALNNPLSLVDPDGREALVFVVAKGNIFRDVFTAQGHAAIYVTRNGRSEGASAGTEVNFDNGISGFLSEYAKQGREVRMYVLGTTAEQDNAMMDFIAGPPTGLGLDSEESGILFRRENCTTAVGNVLEAGGVVPEGSNPGRGPIADRPANLQRELENGQLSDLVEVTHVFEPGQNSQSKNVQSVNSEVIRVDGKLQFRQR